MSIQLMVRPEELKASAESILNALQEIQKMTNRLEDSARKLYPAWEGDAARDFEKQKSSLMSDIAMLIERLQEAPTDLLKMAGIYETADQSALEASETLYTEIIW